MIFFGVDPGTQITGYGIIHTDNNTMCFSDAGILRPPQKASLAEKLEFLYDGLYEKMLQHHPDCVCVEEAFYAKNVHTTLVLGHARGIALLVARKVGAQIAEFSPREIKKTVVGNGNAAKPQVEYMVRSMLRLPEKKISSDMYDALAGAICAFCHMSSIPPC